MKFTMQNRMKPCLCISLVIMAIALVMTFMGCGMNLGIDFTGGTLMTYSMGGEFDTGDVSAALAACGVSDAQIAKTGDNATEVQIRISDKENTDELRSAFEEEISKTYPAVEYVDITRVGATALGAHSPPRSPHPPLPRSSSSTNRAICWVPLAPSLIYAALYICGGHRRVLVTHLSAVSSPPHE